MIDLKMETESADSEYNPNPYSLHMDNTFQKPQNNYSPEENNYMRTVIARSQSDNVRNRPAVSILPVLRFKCETICV